MKLLRAGQNVIVSLRFPTPTRLAHKHEPPLLLLLFLGDPSSHLVFSFSLIPGVHPATITKWNLLSVSPAWRTSGNIFISVTMVLRVSPTKRTHQLSFDPSLHMDPCHHPLASIDCCGKGHSGDRFASARWVHDPADVCFIAHFLLEEFELIVESRPGVKLQTLVWQS